jgi:hypothetical protein
MVTTNRPAAALRASKPISKTFDVVKNSSIRAHST